MNQAPPLKDGETLIYDHIPSVAKFKRLALLVLGLTLIPTALNAIVFPDTIWVAVPLFVASLILMQERFAMGKHRAWVTDQRVIMQGGHEIAVGEVNSAKTGFGIVTLTSPQGRDRLYYSDDPAAFLAAINSVQQGTA